MVPQPPRTPPNPRSLPGKQAYQLRGKGLRPPLLFPTSLFFPHWPFLSPTGAAFSPPFLFSYLSFYGKDHSDYRNPQSSKKMGEAKGITCPMSGDSAGCHGHRQHP